MEESDGDEREEDDAGSDYERPAAGRSKGGSSGKGNRSAKGAKGSASGRGDKHAGAAAGAGGDKAGKRRRAAAEEEEEEEAEAEPGDADGDPAAAPAVKLTEAQINEFQGFEQAVCRRVLSVAVQLCVRGGRLRREHSSLLVSYLVSQSEARSPCPSLTDRPRIHLCLHLCTNLQRQDEMVRTTLRWLLLIGSSGAREIDTNKLSKIVPGIAPRVYVMHRRFVCRLRLLVE